MELSKADYKISKRKYYAFFGYLLFFLITYNDSRIEILIFYGIYDVAYLGYFIHGLNANYRNFTKSWITEKIKSRAPDFLNFCYSTLLFLGINLFAMDWSRVKTILQTWFFN